MSKNIVIVGGGSAGWLTALTAKKRYPKFDVTLIESKEIGILGAGEGSTPYITSFLRSIDISIKDLIVNCDATIKNGIKFVNWNNDNDFFYNGFGVTDASLSTEALSSMFLSASPMIVSSIAKTGGIRDIDFMENVSENNKVPFILEKDKTGDQLSDYKKLGQISIHFNAIKLASRLKEIGLERGVNVIEETITQVDLDENKNVIGLQLSSGKNINPDFVFDCSGFHRLIMGKTLNGKWKSYANFLPVNAAVPFFIEMTDSIPAYTEAIAMKYGWIWKIPLQSRFGCGYVYDSSLISEEEAIKEVEDYLGFVPQYPRKDKGGFSFSAGTFEELWQNNCIAVGLSANFVEPLEATSLWLTMMQLTKVFGSPDFVLNNSQEIRDEFNNSMQKMNDDVLSFIYFHYMSLRKDTDFWKKFSYENAPKDLQKKIDIWQKRLPNVEDDGTVWTGKAWTSVGSAQNNINKNIAKDYLELSEEYDKANELYDYYKTYRDHKLFECIDHREFLERLK